LEQVGVPQRIYNPYRSGVKHTYPIIVPALKVRDFSFTSLLDGI
jgi:hypothetical protein